MPLINLIVIIRKENMGFRFIFFLKNGPEVQATLNKYTFGIQTGEKFEINQLYVDTVMKFSYICNCDFPHYRLNIHIHNLGLVALVSVKCASFVLLLLYDH